MLKDVGLGNAHRTPQNTLTCIVPLIHVNSKCEENEKKMERETLEWRNWKK